MDSNYYDDTYTFKISELIVSNPFSDIEFELGVYQDDELTVHMNVWDKVVETIDSLTKELMDIVADCLSGRRKSAGCVSQGIVSMWIFPSRYFPKTVSGRWRRLRRLRLRKTGIMKAIRSISCPLIELR